MWLFFFSEEALSAKATKSYLFQEPKVPSVSKTRKIAVSEGTAGSMAPGFRAGTQISFQ